MQCLLQGIADEMKGKVSVVKIDTDKYPKIASRYGIKVLPTGCCPGLRELSLPISPAWHVVYLFLIR